MHLIQAGEFAFAKVACVSCPSGTFAPQALTDRCLNCSAGSSTHVSLGATTCSPCDAGSYSASRSVACALCPNGTSAASGQASCGACLPGRYAPAPGRDACDPCAAGQFARVPGAAVCERCPRGKAQAASGQASCLDCKRGNVAHALGASSCSACSAGAFSPSTGLANCTLCPPGRSQGSTGTSGCIFCLAGFASPGAGATSCGACPAGFFAALAGAAACDACEPGRFSAEGQASCALCSPGFFAPLEGTVACAACESGRFAAAAGSTSCSLCGVGTAQGATGQAGCANCSAGFFAETSGLAACTACGSGTHAPSAGSAACAACPPGESQGSTGTSACVACAKGRFADGTGSSVCAACGSGRFSAATGATTCSECAPGTAQGATGQAKCLGCGLGTSSGGFGATSCTPCSTGSVAPNASATSCTPCAAGRHMAASGQAACVACAPGAFSDTQGSSVCSECGAGTVTGVWGATACTGCAPGQFQGRTGEKSCEPCAAGTFQANYGGVGCSACEASSSSRAGASDCVLSAKHYFLDPATSKSKACPSNGECLGGTELPRPRRGFFVDRSSLDFAHLVFRCHRETCTGTDDGYALFRGDGTRAWDDDDAIILGDGGGGKVSANVSAACWARESYGSASGADDEAPLAMDQSGPCASDGLQCLEGSGGILCGSCYDGYTFNSALQVCVRCESTDNTVPVAVFGAVCLAVVAAMVARINGLRLFPRSGRGGVGASNRPRSVLEHLDKGMLKVCWSTYQIVGTIAWNLSIRFPPPFNYLLTLLNFLQLDFLSLDCVSGHNSFFNRVYVVSLTPIAIALFNLLVYACRAVAVQRRIAKHRRSGKKPDHMALGAQAIRVDSQHAFAFLVLTYMVLPPCSKIQFQSLNCVTLPGMGSSFLVADSSIDCRSSAYSSFRVLVCLCIAIYQAIPLLWLFLLWRVRRELNPAAHRKVPQHGRPNEHKGAAAAAAPELLVEGFKDAVVVDLRDKKHPRLRHLAFLWSDYKPDFWFYEVVDM